MSVLNPNCEKRIFFVHLFTNAILMNKIASTLQIVHILDIRNAYKQNILLVKQTFVTFYRNKALGSSLSAPLVTFSLINNDAVLKK